MLPHIPQRAEQLGRYRVIEPLGQGAFGAVFRAQDCEDGREVALKVLTNAKPASLSRFKQEFRALRDLRHPNLVQMQELFEHEGQWVIVMQLVRGHGFLEWVRPATPGVANTNGGAFHEGRLRAALENLAQGLLALHEAGLLHRDLKPANIRITPEGKAVLLDFGLVTELDTDAQSTHAGTPGTAAYMAPEQAAGLKLGAAADWYALGVCLYEALAGRLPFVAETAIGVMLAKQGRLPPPPSAVLMQSANISADIEALCMQLLEPDPAKRAGAHAVAEALSGRAQPVIRLESTEWGETTASMTTLQPTLGVRLQGRETELHVLSDAFGRTQNGELRLVLVEGESGIGKSALVDAFVRGLPERNPGVLVLRGRCYENEQVPYKAFDGCIDELTRALKRMPQERCESLVPARAALIAQLFPVLGAVPAIAKASWKGAAAEPNARRLEAFRVLCDLLDKLAVERPLALVIDDLQWADAESFRLLKAIADYGPPLLIAITVRPLDELQEQVRADVHAVYGYRGTDVISLKGLPPEGTRALAVQLLGSKAPDGWMKTILKESQGHPLFIDALAQYAASHDVRDSQSLSLEKALTARIESVGEPSQRLLDLLALAGRPHDRRLFAEALGMSLDEALAPLLSRKLVRTRGATELACFHDQVRTLVVSRLGQGGRVSLHLALAKALSEHSGIDPSEAAYHWAQAGEREQAVAAYESAADSALAALAFARAAGLYQHALDLLSDTSRESWKRLTVQRAHALARGGRSSDAALLYQAAARQAEGDERVRLGIWTAQHLLQSAQVGPGLTAARALLEELGMGLPRGEKGATARILWDRARIGMRGLALKPAAGKGIDSRTALQLEAAWKLSAPLAVIDLPAERQFERCSSSTGA